MPGNAGMRLFADLWMWESNKIVLGVQVRVFGEIFAIHRRKCGNPGGLQGVRDIPFITL